MPKNEGPEYDHDPLIDQLRKGIDIDTSFRSLFHRYYLLIVHFFRARSIPEDHCHDLAQEVFLKIYGGITSFRGESKFEAWMFAIANNVLKKDLRRRMADKRSANETSLDSAVGSEWLDESLLAEQPEPLDNLIGKELAQQLRIAISRLPEQMRQCFVLRFYQDLSYNEIAQVLQTSVDAVKVQLFRARSRLRQELGQHIEL